MPVKELEMTMKEIEQMYNEGLQKTQLPPSQHLPKITFGYRRDGYGDGEYFVIIQHGEYHFGSLERGLLGDIYSSTEENDVLYYLFCRAAYYNASYNIKMCSILFRTDKYSYKRLMCKMELELLSIISPQFSQRKRKEYEDDIVEHPFRDEFPNTLAFLDDYPCPVLSPNILPSSCPLKGNGGACSLVINEV
jgi:hypothetical protein